MKFTNSEAFFKEFEKFSLGHFPSICLLMGKEFFERKEVEDKIIRQFLSALPSKEEALLTFDAEDCSIHSLIDTLSSFSFFSANRIICLHHAEKLDKHAFQLLENAIESLSKQDFFILSAEAINRASKLYKKIDKIGFILDFEEQKPWEKEASLTNKAMEWAEEAGKKLDRQTARIFVQYAGIDQMQLRSEMDKLLCYIGDKSSITKQEIQAICTKAHIENNWQLGDAILEKNAPLCLETLASLQASDLSFFSLSRQLRSQFQIKLQICALLSGGGGIGEIQQKYPYMKGTLLEQNMRVAKQFGYQSLKKGILQIDKTELLAKNSALDTKILLEQLILQLLEL